MVDPETLAPKERPLDLKQEGATHLFLPEHEVGQKGPAHRRAVFYNPAMALSRDMSVSVATAEAARQGHKLRVWDALAATGVRGLRLLTETQAVESVLATDQSLGAFRTLEQNAAKEGSGRLVPLWHDAETAPERRSFDLVDIDPFGTPVPFLRAGVEAVVDGGMLAVTATDMAVLAGPETQTCLTRYGARAVRGYLSREGAMRILIAKIRAEAQVLNRTAVPQLSVIGGYHIRGYFRILAGNPTGEHGVSQVPFEGYEGPPLLNPRPSGPLWTGKLHDRDFVRSLPEIAHPGEEKAFPKLLTTLKSEAEVDCLFYHETGVLSKRLHLRSPPSRETIFEAVRAEGARITETHASPSGWRTELPLPRLEEIFRRIDR